MTKMQKAITCNMSSRWQQKNIMLKTIYHNKNLKNDFNNIIDQYSNL
jgi:hypothetical protein